MKKYLLILACTVLITACNEETKSVEYYKAHQDEAVQVNQKCTASGEDSVNCRNAKSGIQRVDQSEKADQGTHF